MDTMRSQFGTYRTTPTISDKTEASPIERHLKCVDFKLNIVRSARCAGVLKSILTLTLATALGSAAQANVIVNGGFEEPVIAANSAAQVAPTDWNCFECRIINGDFSTLYPLPHSGSQSAHLGNDGDGPAWLSQSFSVAESGTYPLTWFDSTEFNGPGNTSPYTVSVTDPSSTVIASVSLDANALALRVWTPRSLPLDLLGGTAYTLRFQSHQAPFGEGSMIDDVSLVPEPATAAVLLIGIALTLATRCFHSRVN